MDRRAEEMDARLRRMAEQDGNKEVLAWLRSAPSGKEHSLGTLVSTAESVDLVNELYKLGPEEVLAFEIDGYDWGENTGKLIIRLPSDSEKRRGIFAWAAGWSIGQGYEPTVDEGQRYLFVMLD